MGDRARRDASIKKALELSDRLPERFRYQIQITAYSYSTANYPQLIDVATKLLAKYPDDDFGLNFLGTIRCNTEEYERCAELREANVKVNPSFLSASNAASVYAYLGQYDKRRRVLESYLERAVSMLAPFTTAAIDQNAVTLDLLARAYTGVGDLAKARETYEKITTLTTVRMAWGATYARAFYHLSRIAEQQGDKAPAREQFQKFLDLWKDADKGLIQVADARKRLAQ